MLCKDKTIVPDMQDLTHDLGLKMKSFHGKSVRTQRQLIGIKMPSSPDSDDDFGRFFAFFVALGRTAPAIRTLKHLLYGQENHPSRSPQGDVLRICGPRFRRRHSPLLHFFRKFLFTIGRFGRCSLDRSSRGLESRYPYMEQNGGDPESSWPWLHEAPFPSL